MSAETAVRRPLAVAPSVPRPPAVAAARRSDLLAPARRLASLVRTEWAPLVLWHVGRTGRVGLVGIALLLASAMFFFSTHLQVVGEAAALRADLANARARAATTPAGGNESAQVLRHLPSRAEMPALLGVLLQQADDAKLTVDTGKYEMTTAKAGAITRYRVSFPVTGPYPQVRKFIDATLLALPAVAITELNIERKAIGDGAVEARLRLTFYTRGAP